MNTKTLQLPLLVIIALVTLVGCGGDPEGMVWRYKSARRALPLPVDHSMYGIQVVGDLVIFCGGDGWNRRGHLGALRLEDGVRMWRHTVGWCDGGPQIVDSIAVGWGTQPEYVSMKGANIRNGILLWRRAFEPGHFQYQQPVAFGKHVYLPFADELHQISLTRGHVTHVHADGCPAKQRAWIAANHKRMVFGCGPRVFDVARDTLQMRFLFELPERLHYPEHFTIADSVLYIADRGRRGKLLAVNLNTGGVIWRDSIGASDAPAVEGDVAYYPGRGLIAVDKNTGRQKWRLRLRTFYRPLYANGMLYSSDHDSVVQIDAATGAIKRRFKARREVLDTPVIAGDLLLFGDLGGNLYAVRL